jgi:uncharacterized protein YlxP (DUF503 family)
MRVGLLRVRLLLRESRSLKDKRGVIKSIKERLKNRFNISVAEVGGLNSRQVAELGIALVANDRKFIESSLSKALSFIRGNPFAEVSESDIEII